MNVQMSKAGRPSKNEVDKKKVRPIRLSDNEMLILGEPSSIEMRKILFEHLALRNLCKCLDEEGVDLFSDEFLESYFRNGVKFGSNEAILSALMMN